MSWRFTLNNDVIENPVGWSPGAVVTERHDEIRGLLYSYAPDLTFHGYGYSLLYNEWINNNYCEPVEVLIEQQCNDGTYEEFFKGLIHLTFLELNFLKCTAKATIFDRTYRGLIEGARQIEVTPGVGRSRNDVSITAATERNITFFTPCTGVNTAPAVKCFSVFDVMKEMVEFMTDGQVTFDSSLLGSGGDYEGWHLTTGQAIRDKGNSYPPRTSFKKLFDEINKKLNVTFYIDSAPTVPILYVESSETVYEASTVTTLNNVKEIEASLDRDHIYSTVVLGSSINQRATVGCPTDYAHPNGRFFGHKSETYHTLGNCPVDNQLDLESEYIIDSNVIQDILINGNDEFDDEIVLIETDYPNTNVCIKGDQFDATARTYNPGISNQAALVNFFGSVPQSIAAFLGPPDDEFEAQLSADTNSAGGAILGLGSPVPFSIEITDVGGNYDNTATNYKYVVPADGAYYFEVVARVKNIVWAAYAESGDIDIVCQIEVDRGSGFAVEKTFNTGICHPNNPSCPADYYDNGNFFEIFVEMPFTLYLDSADEVRVKLLTLQDSGAGPGTNSFTLAQESRFACIQATNGGGIYETFDPRDVRLILYKFEHPLSFADHKTILAGNKQKVAIVNDDGFTDEGWLDNLEYDAELGVAEWIVRVKNEERP